MEYRLPSNIRVGDLVVIPVSHRAEETVVGPSGWTLAERQDHDFERVTWFSRVFVAGDPTKLTFVIYPIPGIQGAFTNDRNNPMRSVLQRDDDNQE